MSETLNVLVVNDYVHEQRIIRKIINSTLAEFASLEQTPNLEISIVDAYSAEGALNLLSIKEYSIILLDYTLTRPWSTKKGYDGLD